MKPKINISINTPIRKKISYAERWNGLDKGIITAWEVGRELRNTNLSIVQKVAQGELPILVFKGGHKKKLKSTTYKYGSMHYLAQLQGIKNLDLAIDLDTDEGLVLVCSKTGMETIFSSNAKNYKD